MATAAAPARPDAERVRDRICFYQEREAVELRVDGVPVERPTTPWAGTSWLWPLG